MANYKQHLTGGIIYGILCMTASIFTLGLTIVEGFVLLILGALGSILPDIDSDTSIPVHLVCETVGVLVPIIIIKKVFANELNTENMIFLIVVGFIVVRYLAFLIFFKLTVHRGIIHSIPAALIAGGLVFLLFSDASFYLRLLYGVACAVGFIVHLIMDEIWSVDLKNTRLKNSFGTALTFRSSSLLSTVIAYVIIVLIASYILINIPIPEQFNIKHDKLDIAFANNDNTVPMNFTESFLTDINSTWDTLYKKWGSNLTPG